MALPWPTIFKAHPWSKVLMALTWPKILMVLQWPKIQQYNKNTTLTNWGDKQKIHEISN